MLSPRQLETLVHLKDNGLKTPEEVIFFCEEKLKLPHKQSVRRSKKPERQRRRHSKRYYQEIILFMKGSDE